MHLIDAERSAGILKETTHNHVDDYASEPGAENKAYPEMRAAKYSDYQDENHSWRKFGRN